ncbi:MAG: aldose 1-epimerase family protein, partial [Gammaproteobacteria bacterium]|nr:aldose 1-epimerase family protein [Gammaproteobacteria bacterium]
LVASFLEKGAELVSLKCQHQEALWGGAPDVWPRHAPVLFPIVGRLKDDAMIVYGKNYGLTQHGFARDLDFSVTHVNESQICFLLQATKETLSHYPFHFSLSVLYTLQNNSLLASFIVRNNSNTALPFSLGWHPAFAVPNPSYSNKARDYSISFSAEEDWRTPVLENGLLTLKTQNPPVTSRQISWSETLFDQDALIFLSVNSRAVELRSQEKIVLRMDTSDFPTLGIWSKPKAGFICLEPWVGYASPADFKGEFGEKPGIVTLPPYSERRWDCRIDFATS